MSPPDPTPVPLQDLQRQYRQIAPEIDAAIRAVLDSGQYVGGAEVSRLEEEFAAACGSGFAVGCASGTDALWLALRAVGVGPGDEVVCPAYSFVATASTVALLGARPVFADVDPSTYTMTPQDARRAAQGCGRLRAVVPVDLFGLCADPPGFEALGEELGVAIVTDAAQSIGARDAEGEAAGSRARLGCFSLYPTKNVGAYGDAGVVVGRDPELRRRLRSFAAHGSSSPNVYEEIGINSRIDGLQAAVVRVKLRHLEEWTKRRRENAAFYDAELARAGAADSATPLDAGGLPLRTPRAPAAPARHVYHHYVVRVPADVRSALRAHLSDRGIATGLYYDRGLHQQPCFAHLGPQRLPETEAAARETLVLPVHPELGSDQRRRVVEAVVGFFQR